MYQRILLPVDGSDHSMRSAKEALKIAIVSKGCSVELVFVADFAKTKSEILHSQTKEELELIRRKKFVPFEELFESNHIDYKVVILHGEPAASIIEYANQGDFDLLVIGSKGKGNITLQDMVLGSVSHKVVKRVNSPVLVVK
jgi:nucleotide-binding universal stress UspA family protein